MLCPDIREAIWCFNYSKALQAAARRPWRRQSGVRIIVGQVTAVRRSGGCGGIVGCENMKVVTPTRLSKHKWKLRRVANLTPSARIYQF